MLLVYVAKVYLPLRSGILNLKIFMNLRGGFFPQKKSEKYNHSLILNFRFEYFEEKKISKRDKHNYTNKYEWEKERNKSACCWNVKNKDHIDS